MRCLFPLRPCSLHAHANAVLSIRVWFVRIHRRRNDQHTRMNAFVQSRMRKTLVQSIMRKTGRLTPTYSLQLLFFFSSTSPFSHAAMHVASVVRGDCAGGSSDCAGGSSSCSELSRGVYFLASVLSNLVCATTTRRIRSRSRIAHLFSGSITQSPGPRKGNEKERQR